MKNLRLLLTIIALSFSLIGHATNLKPEELTSSELKRFIKNSEKTLNYKMAIQYCNELLKRENSVKNNNLMAELYEKNMEYAKAAEFYGIVCERMNGKSVESCYKQAVMLKMKMEYGKAVEVLDASYTKRTAKDYNAYARQIKIELRNCNSLNLEQPTKQKVYINKVQIEDLRSMGIYSPIILDSNNILFTSKTTGNTYCKLYKFNNSSEDCRLQVSNMLKEDYFPNSHIANGAFSPDGKRFYFTIVSESASKITHTRIYRIEFNGLTWSEPEDLQEINLKKYQSTYPAVGVSIKTGQDVLYFSSNRPGGYGGMDLWYSEYNQRNQAFTQPRNLGSKVNSEGNEVTPYYDATDNLLYYSSDGKGGYGGLDVFSAEGEKRRWSIKSMGMPVNSGTDDFYFTKKDGTAYLVSSRDVLDEGGSKRIDNLYAINIVNRYNVTGRISIMDKYNALSQKLSSKYDLDLEPGIDKLNNISITVMVNNRNKPSTIVEEVRTNNNGQFSLQLEEGKSYQILVNSDAYFQTYINIDDLKTDKDLDTIQIEEIPQEGYSFVVRNCYNQDGTFTSEMKAFINDFPSIRFTECPHSNSAVSLHFEQVDELFAEVMEEN